MANIFAKIARYYDKIYHNKDYAHQARQLISIFGADTGKKRSLLDIACGTGLHIEHLMANFQVEGLDICPELLEIARERAPGVVFHVGDMTDFDLGTQYDIVTCLFSSIGYVKTHEKLRLAVRCMSAHVKPGGMLVIEPWFTPSNWHPNMVHGLYIDEPELKIARVNTSFVNGTVSVFDLHYLIGTCEGTEHIVEHHELGLFEVEEMLSAIEETGLTVEHDPEGLNGRGLYIGKA